MWLADRRPPSAASALANKIRISRNKRHKEVGSERVNWEFVGFPGSTSASSTSGGTGSDQQNLNFEPLPPPINKRPKQQQPKPQAQYQFSTPPSTYSEETGFHWEVDPHWEAAPPPLPPRTSAAASQAPPPPRPASLYAKIKPKQPKPPRTSDNLSNQQPVQLRRRPRSNEHYDHAHQRSSQRRSQQYEPQAVEFEGGLRHSLSFTPPPIPRHAHGSGVPIPLPRSPPAPRPPPHATPSPNGGGTSEDDILLLNTATHLYLRPEVVAGVDSLYRSVDSPFYQRPMSLQLSRLSSSRTRAASTTSAASSFDNLLDRVEVETQQLTTFSDTEITTNPYDTVSSQLLISGKMTKHM